MVHRLANPDNPSNAVGRSPFVVSMRYRCACGNRELLTIQTVIDLDAPEGVFIETMRMMRADMRLEVHQHLERTDAE